MPIGIPESMQEEHEELHKELRRATKMPGEVGKAAQRVAEVLHPHFERENELALPVIGIARELAEGKEPSDSANALKLHDQFRKEYRQMLREHEEILEALEVLSKAAKKSHKREVVEFTRKLAIHAQVEEALTYPAVLLIGRILKQK